MVCNVLPRPICMVGNTSCDTPREALKHGEHPNTQQCTYCRETDTSRWALGSMKCSLVVVTAFRHISAAIHPQAKCCCLRCYSNWNCCCNLCMAPSWQRNVALPTYHLQNSLLPCTACPSPVQTPQYRAGSQALTSSAKMALIP
jgi:hypothetical protein